MINNVSYNIDIRNNISDNIAVSDINDKVPALTKLSLSDSGE